jgi:hypothetical protein
MRHRGQPLQHPRTQRWTLSAPAQNPRTMELLILDDRGLAPLTSQQGRDLLEIIDTAMLGLDDRNQSSPSQTLA